MSRFDRNFTKEGYLMNYETPEISTPLNRQVLQLVEKLLDRGTFDPSEGC